MARCPTPSRCPSCSSLHRMGTRSTADRSPAPCSARWWRPAWGSFMFRRTTRSCAWRSLGAVTTERTMAMNVLFEGMADMASGDSPAVTALCLDSRQITPGAVFVALAGLQAHGLDFVEEACRRGAVAVVHDGHSQADERPDEI